MPTASKPAVPLDERERAALLNLLGDEDPGVYAAVRDRILGQGPSVCDWLRPHALSSDPVLRKRVHALINHFERHAADREFTAFCLRYGETFDLETAVLLLARTTYPEINPAAYRALLDEYAETLRPRLAGISAPRGRLEIINEYLFEELGFRGNQEDYFDPRNSYLTQALDRRTGNPISLCTVYLLLAHRLQLPIAGIGLPGHFVCRYQSSVAAIYIDVFERGRLLSKADCVQYLVHSAFGLHDQFLAPVPSRRMVMRMCGNLHQSYLHFELHEEAERMQGYLTTLSRQPLL
jgi:regulator of sirC expression with transglutaminase-like and TPR domain